MTNKLCLDCGELKPFTEYYRAGIYYQSRCMPCHNLKRKLNYKYNKIKSGFQRLPDETKINLIDDLKTMKKKDVARKYEITYTTLTRWIRKGKIIHPDQNT